jgi:DNA-binding transcriptional MerR regulator
MEMEKTYGPKAVCRLVGISQRQLGYWTLIGVIKPTKQTHGSKIFNRYTDPDIETLRRVKELTEEGFFVSKAAEKVQKETAETGLSDRRPRDSESAMDPIQGTNPGGLSSSLYLEVRLNEELARIEHCYRPLSGMAVRVAFPSQFAFSPERSRILFQLSNILVSRKEPSDVVSYKKESTFLWLLPNRTLEETHLFSKDIKKLIEDPEWEIQGKKFRLTALFGFSSDTFKSQQGGILADAEQNLNDQKMNGKGLISFQTGTNGSYKNYVIEKNRSSRR